MTSPITDQIESEYSEHYKAFMDFQTEEAFRPLWDLCIKTAGDRNALNLMEFCNDNYQIPPVRVFVDRNRKDLETLRSRDNGALFSPDGQLKTYMKQCLGAFWGMVFRFCLHYNERKSCFVASEKYFGIRTASRFEKRGAPE